MKNTAAIQSLLSTIGSFSENDHVLFENAVSQRQIPSDTILLSEGQVCQTAYFLISGNAYQYCISDGDEQIIDLHIPGDWCLGHASFVAQQPSENILQTFTDTDVFELDIHRIHQLIAVSPAFFQFGRIFEQTSARLQYYDQALSPAGKYKHLLSNRPQVIRDFPLKLIASFLKMTPETLSRVRSSI